MLRQDPHITEGADNHQGGSTCTQPTSKIRTRLPTSPVARALTRAGIVHRYDGNLLRPRNLFTGDGHSTNRLQTVSTLHPTSAPHLFLVCRLDL